jgi:purine-binding chemotaxis protein CheW
MKELSKLPESPAYLRGVINLRGTVIPVVDLRKRLGMPGSVEETEALIQLLRDKEQDHINWLNELRKSVEENREFKLSTDPHKCAFGKWYDAYRTTNNLLAMQLRKFDEPHKQIHSIAVVVKNLENQGKRDEAFAVIDQAWDNELTTLRGLFEDSIVILKEFIREIIIIGEHDGTRIGYVVDSVTDVIDIPQSNIEQPPAAYSGDTGGCIQGLGKVGENIKILLDTRHLLESEYLKQISERAAG